MASILTPEEICQLDTFTLEEKVQQLQSSPDALLYYDLLKMAKLELIDRLQIQQFGRRLANDQYQIIEEFKYPSFKPKIPEKVLISKPQGTANGRKDNLSKFQTNLLSAGSVVTIGKPAVNPHFKPSTKRLEYVEPSKNFLRSKKQAFSKGKLHKAIIVHNKQQIIKKEQILLKDKKAQQTPVTIQQTPVLLQKRKKEEEISSVIEQFSLKQKLKKEVQQMEVIYHENDAYDDIKRIKIQPQNLINEEIRMKEIQPIATQIDEPEEDHIKINQQKQELQQIIYNHHQFQEISVKNSPKLDKRQEKTILKNEQELQQFIPFELNVQLPNKNNNQLPTFHLLSVEQFKDTNQNAPNGFQRQNQIVPIINFDVLNQSSVPKQNKQIKSCSVRSFNKQPYQNLLTDVCKTSKGDEGGKKSYQKINSIRTFKDEVKADYKMIKSNYGGFRSQNKPQVYPYHEIIQSFHKLFPHSKNLLITLRNVQQNLKLHCSKKIDDRSKNNQYLRLNENDITFKVISQSEKAKKYSHYFGIDIQTFHKRGEIMLNRIKKEDFDEESSNIMLYRVVRTKEEVYDIVNCSFHRTKCWYELPHGMELKASWNILWTWSRPQIEFTDLFYFQKVNHFIGNKQIARKDLLKKNIQNVQKLGGKMKQYFDIIPQTFLLPGENIAFIKKFRENGIKDPLNYWILKPVGLSRGRGIELINKLQDVIFAQPVVLQRYISNPFLLDGFKFDMRIYVLVTSINPLEAYIYRQGFARLSTQRYDLGEESKDNKYIHLTNFSINRENISDKKLTLEQQLGGCKISLRMLREQLERSGISWQRIWRQVQEVILKSLIACMNVIPANPNCFELFGYDIFLDADLKCWLLEVNSSPSLEKQFMLDEIIKQQLVDDIMELVGPISYSRQRLLEVVERRRKQAEGLKSSISTGTNSTWQLDQDLNYILNGQKLRRYGQSSHKNFINIAPSDRYYSIVKVLQQYKIDPIIKQQK